MQVCRSNARTFFFEESGLELSERDNVRALLLRLIPSALKRAANDGTFKSFTSGYRIVVIQKISNLRTGVRFPLPAPTSSSI